MAACNACCSARIRGRCCREEVLPERFSAAPGSSLAPPRPGGSFEGNSPRCTLHPVNTDISRSHNCRARRIVATAHSDHFIVAWCLPHRRPETHPSCAQTTIGWLSALPMRTTNPAARRGSEYPITSPAANTDRKCFDDEQVFANMIETSFTKDATAFICPACASLEMLPIPTRIFIITQALRLENERLKNSLPSIPLSVVWYQPCITSVRSLSLFF